MGKDFDNHRRIFDGGGGVVWPAARRLVQGTIEHRRLPEDSCRLRCDRCAAGCRGGRVRRRYQRAARRGRSARAPGRAWPDARFAGVSARVSADQRPQGAVSRAPFRPWSEACQRVVRDACGDTIERRIGYEQFDPDIIRSIWNDIATASYVVADLTHLNPNAALELAIGRRSGARRSSCRRLQTSTSISRRSQRFVSTPTRLIVPAFVLSAQRWTGSLRPDRRSGQRSGHAVRCSCRIGPRGKDSESGARTYLASGPRCSAASSRSNA